MTCTRCAFLFASLTLLSACGDSPSEQAAAPQEAPVETAAPTTPETQEMTGETVSAGFDASTKYEQACASCHGKTGEGVGDFPSLATLSRDLIQTRLLAYRAGETVGPRSTIMAPMAKNLSEEEIAALASYLGN